MRAVLWWFFEACVVITLRLVAAAAGYAVPELEVYVCVVIVLYFWAALFTRAPEETA